LQHPEQSLDAPFGLRRVRRDPLDPQLRQSAAELRARRISPQLPLKLNGTHSLGLHGGIISR